MESKKNLIDASFLRNAFFSYGTQGLKLALGFAWVIMLTTAAGLEIYGMIALMTSLSGVISNVFSFRTNESVVKFYKRGEVESMPGLCRLAIVAGLLLDFVVAVLLCALVQYFATTIASELLKAPQTAVGVVAYSWIILATFLRGTGIGLLTATERFRFIYSLTTIEQFLRVVILVVALQLDIVLTLDTVVWIIFFPTLVVSIVFVALPVLKILSTFKGVPIPIGEVRNFARFSLSTFISSSLKAGNQSIDTIILGYLTSPASVGVYSLFRQFLSPLTIAIGPFYEQIYPRFVKAVVKNEFEIVENTVKQTNSMLFKWSALLLCAITAAVVTYWWYMDFDFNIEFCLTFIFMAASSMILQQLWWTRGFALSINPNISIVANIIFTILVVSMVFFFTSQFGLVGTAIGYMISGAVMYTIWRYILLKYCR